MKKEYFGLFVALALLPAVSFGREATIDSSGKSNTRAIQLETRTNAQIDFRAAQEARKAELEAQRERLKAAAEERKAAAQRLGDEMKARREALKVEMEEKRAEIDAKREAVRVEVEVKREEIKEKREEIRQDVAQKKVLHTVRAMSATVERFTKIIARLESKIGKVKLRGGDTAESERLVTEAKTHLSEAKASISAFASIDLSGETIQENFKRIRALAAEAREHLRATHESLMMSVRALNAVEVDEDTDSSTTTE